MFDICKQKTIAIFAMVFLEAPTRFELVIEVLQTFAVPLGYGALVTPRGFEPLLPP